MKEKLTVFMKRPLVHDLGVAGKVILYQVMAILMICGVLYISNWTFSVSPRVMSPLPTVEGK